MSGGCLDPSFVICQIRHLGLIRVLQLDNIILEDSLMDAIGSLFHLRLLEIRTEVKALPLSWLNLQNLETLLISSNGSIMVLLPTILKLSKLKHVDISFCSFFGNEPTLMLEAENSKLTTLSRVHISCSEDTNDALEKFPNLQHLHCRIVEPMYPPTHGNWFPKFDVLNKLESLNLEYNDNSCISGYYVKSTVEIPPPNEYHFPTNLKDLQLHYFPLTPTLLSAIAALPKLEILDFTDCNFIEDEWDASEDIYQSLKTLRLECVQFSEWQVDTETFPKLEKLIIDQCNELKEIPCAFGDIDTLKSIRVAHINRDFGNSAMEIKKDVAAYTGEDRLDVHICVLGEDAEEEDDEEENAQMSTTKKPHGRRPRTYSTQ